MLLAALAFATPSSALEEIVLDIGRLDAGRWSAAEVELRLGFPEEGRLSAKLTGAGLALPEPFHTLSSVSLDCPAAVATESGLECARAELRVRGNVARIEPLPLALRLERSARGWRLEVEAAGLAPGPLWTFAARLGLLPDLDIGDGVVDLVLDVGGDASMRLDARLSDIDFSDAQGLHAGEDVGARLAWRVSPAASGWRTGAELELDAGQIYLHPVFVDAGTAPVSVSAAGSIDADSGRLRLSRVRFHHRGVASIEGAIDVAANGAVEALALRLASSPVAPLYATYLQPFAIGTLFDAVTVDGRVAARLDWQPGLEGRRVRITLDGIDVDDDAGRFNLFGVRGQVDWSATAGGDVSRVSWEGGQIYRIDFGAGVLEGRFSARRFDLGAPLEIPLLEGGVRVSDLRANDIGSPDMTWKFRGSVQPMSLTALTAALDWPSFGGTLAGDIPLVSYANGVISVDGSLDVEVFDGTVRIRQLSVADPFGVIPMLRADVDIDDLSLDALTGTFAFGNIQGRLQGRVHGLVLRDWEPTTFEARFATPEDDDSRHRISQRAVENLASLGGAGAALSSTFLRIFDEFSYRRLGIGCRLENGVCEMHGVAPAERGYYIVEGGGLPPRIDVLGFNRQVDWEVLLGRLRQIVASEGPVIR